MPPVARMTRLVAQHARAPALGGEHAVDAALVNEQAPRCDAFEDRDRWACAHGGDDGAHDLAAGRVTCRMYDAAAPMRGLEAERQRARRVAIECGAEFDEAGDGFGRLVEDSFGGGGIAKPVPGGQRIGDMQHRGVVGPDGSCDAALRPGARGLLAERGGREDDAWGRCQRQRRRQPGEAGRRR